MIGKSLPLQNNYFKVSFLRAPDNPQSAFAAEQAVDELAYMAKMDPVAFRLQNVANLTDDPPQRWKNVLTNVAKDVNWKAKVAASNLSSANVVTGRGIAFGFYSNTMTCCVADIEVNKKTGKILAKQLHVAGDPGLIVYPAGSENNEEGAAMQGLSRALHEAVVFDKKAVTSLDWVSYPMIRFKDAPKVHIHGLTRTDVNGPGRSGLADDRLGRAGAVAGPGGGRQRLLRRHGPSHPRGAHDAGPRPRGAEGRRPVGARRAAPAARLTGNERGPLTGPSLLTARSSGGTRLLSAAMPLSATVSRSAPNRLPRVYLRCSVGSSASACGLRLCGGRRGDDLDARIRHLAAARAADRQRSVLAHHHGKDDHRVAPGADRRLREGCIRTVYCSWKRAVSPGPGEISRRPPAS